MEVNLSAIEQQEDEQLYCRLPLANVTRSMQELFEHEKLQYLQAEQNDRNGNQEFFPEHTKVLESGDCGDTCHNSGLSSSVQYVLPSPPECESHEEQCPQHHECKETIKSKVSEGDKDTEAGNDCWNERFKHIRNRAAERQKNAPRLLITKPLKLRLSKTNLLRKKSAKATHSGSPMKVNHIVTPNSIMLSGFGKSINFFVVSLCFITSPTAAISTLVQNIVAGRWRRIRNIQVAILL